MLFDFNQYSAPLLIFFVHGLVYAGLLAQRGLREGRRSDGWLAGFLLLCVLHIAPWMLGFAGWYDNQPYRDLLFYIPFQHLFALGPLVYFYVQSLLNPSFRFNRRAALHCLPAVAYLAYAGVIVVTDKLVLRRYWFLADGSDPDFSLWYQLAGFVSMVTYGYGSLRYYQHFRLLMLQVSSNAEGLAFRWVRRFLLAFLAMLLLRVVFFLVSLAGFTDYSDSWWYYLGFGVLFYAIAIRGYGNAQQATVGYRALLSEEKAVLLPEGPVPAGGEEEPIPVSVEESAPATDPLAGEWKGRIEALLAGEAPYRDPELSLSALAGRLGLPAAQLSRIINKGYGCNFNDFINGYRVRAVQDELAAGAHLRQTLVSIAYDCGFNSKATFNRAFLKHTGKAPSDFVRSLE
ncbi:AraC family transcriptional regulator [Flaviaesturariibacter amylovorans]|uniref:HTH araC/xylS-type domain-containing protein n=1 Tax=Flaviaesturariibacter amylovorans TaxID=1084520 RepID=A0ABP8G5Z3_9BACT